MSAGTPAERFARARIEFVEAMTAGCTIVELRCRKRALKHRAKADAASHTADLMDGPACLSGFQSWDAQWMGRD